MKDLAGPEQCSFIPGRQTSDNIVILQEIIHTAKRLKGRKGIMVVKVDLEKAYDRINWNFLKHTLHLAGFPNELIKLIMSCVEVDSTEVLCRSRGILWGNLALLGCTGAPPRGSHL